MLDRETALSFITLFTLQGRSRRSALWTYKLLLRLFKVFCQKKWMSTDYTLVVRCPQRQPFRIAKDKV